MSGDVGGGIANTNWSGAPNTLPLRLTVGFCSVFLMLPLTIIVLPGVLSAHEAQEQDWSFQFSHAVHLTQAGLDCETCHSQVTSSQAADDDNLPTKETCLLCHDGESPDACATCHFTATAAGTLEREARPVKFNHQLHLSIPDLAGRIPGASGSEVPPAGSSDPSPTAAEASKICIACHRGLDQVDFGGPRNMPLMSDCLTCHTPEGNAMHHCGKCHVADFDLFPASHRPEDFFDSHSSEEAAHNLAECRECHTPNFNPCTQCH